MYQKVNLKRRDFLKAIGVGAASLTVSGCSGVGQLLSVFQPKRKPNIVFIYIDDLGWADVAYQGAKFYETPNIDKLASEGMVFTDAYANAPNCAPSRACLMSGQYTPRHGIYTVGSSTRGHESLRKLIPISNNNVLPTEIVTIAEALKPAGYTSACIGKWHLGRGRDFSPTGQGFEVRTANEWSQTHFSPYRTNTLKDGPEGEYLTDRLTDEALKFIQANKDRPFFLYLSHYTVHSPWQAKKELIAKYEKKKPVDGYNNPTYAGMIESMDESVGRVMEKLDELKLTDNTVVVFFSDNGGVGVITTMAPLRGGKGMLYEGGIRVPLIIRWPAKVKAGAVCSTPVIGIDFHPTFLEIAGAARPKNHILDGVSLMPLLTGIGTLKPRALHWHFPAYLQSWPFVEVPWRTTPVAVTRQGNWKLMEFFEDGRLELYNLKEDIGETNNLAKKLPEKTKELHEVMLAWRKAINAPVPTHPNPKYDPTAKYEAKPKVKSQGVHRIPPSLGGEIEELRRKRGW